MAVILAWYGPEFEGGGTGVELEGGVAGGGLLGAPALAPGTGFEGDAAKADLGLALPPQPAITISAIENAATAKMFRACVL